MEIYRGVKDILFKNINHLFRNDDLTFLDYGQGTSYAYERRLAEDYFKLNKNFAWLITSEFSPRHPMYIYPKDLVEEDNIDEGFFFDGKVIERNDIAEFAEDFNHDCIIFEYDDSDPHILLLRLANEPIIKEVDLCTEKQEIVDALRKFKFPFDGTIYKIPLNKIKEVDEILENFI